MFVVADFNMFENHPDNIMSVFTFTTNENSFYLNCEKLLYIKALLTRGKLSSELNPGNRATQETQGKRLLSLLIAKFNCPCVSHSCS